MGEDHADREATEFQTTRLSLLVINRMPWKVNKAV